MKSLCKANKALGAVTVAIEMRSVFLAVFGESLIGHMKNVACWEWTQAPELDDVYQIECGLPVIPY